LLARLTLKLLGAPTLSVGAQPLPALAAIDVALLAVLALEGELPRQQVAALLWPDADPAGAATNLRQRIYRLKRLAGRGVIDGERSIALPHDLQHDMQGYAEQLAADPAHGRGALLGSLSFAGHDALSSWLAMQREALTQTRVRVLSKAAQAHAADGRLSAAQQAALAWLHHAPTDEQAHRLHIQLLYQQGNRAGALLAYRQCEQLLRTELGVEPSAATQALLVQLEAAGMPAPAAVTSIPMALLRPPLLVAREAPWRQMALAAAAGQVLVLTGEAGLGKSRLLGDFVEGREAWCLVAASPGDGVLPFAFLARLLSAGVARWGRPAEAWVCGELARLAPETGSPSNDAFAAVRLQQAVRAALVHWHAQGLAGVALDDLHHADASSLTLLLPLMASTETTGLPWLMATRPPLAEHGLDALPRLDLQPLSLPDVQELVSSLGLTDLRHEAWAPLLLQRTGGNPLYLLQTLTAAFEGGTLRGGAPPTLAPLPASLSSLLASRMERLSPAARSIARLACVAGPDFTLELACQLLGAQPAALADPWWELHAAQVMRDGHFAHDLIRDAALAITPPEVSSLIHAQVAQALAQAHAPAGRIAAHWDAAGRWPEAARAYEKAALQARAQGAIDDELLKLQAATRCHRATGTPDASAAAFATERRTLELRVFTTQLGEETRTACEALLATATNDDQRAHAQVLIAQYWSERYEPAQGLQAAQNGLQLARECKDLPLLLLATQRLGALLGRLGRYDEAVQTFRMEVARLDALQIDERLNWLNDYGLALDYADQRTEALEVLDRVIEEALRHGRWAAAAGALSPKSVALGYLGRTADSLEALEQSIALCRRAGIEGEGLLVDEATCAGNLRDLGHFSAYLQRAEGLPRSLRDAGSDFWAANAEHDLATAYAWLGRADLALRTLAGATECLSPLMQAVRLTTRSRLARDYGVGAAGPRPQKLLEEAVSLLDSAKATGRSHLRLAIALQAARDAEPALGLATATQLEEEGLQRQNAILAASASCVRLRILLANGHASAACAVATALLDRLGEFGPPAGVYPAELWCLAAEAMLRDEPARAQATRALAVQWVLRTAQDHVPALYRESFLTKNPFNAALLSGDQQR
jgi:DNA-binding SARP family transcriptional activator